MAFWDQRVLFIDGEALVIDKPAGLAVASRRAHAGEPRRLSAATLRFGFQRTPLPVHRLDRDTSGCLLLARNPKAHKRFQRAFEARQVGKTYLAVLDGVPAGGGGDGRARARQGLHRRGGLADGARSGRPAGGDALAASPACGTGAP